MNKLKGSSSAVRMRHLIAIFAVTLLVSLPIRIYQLLVMVNPENGFFENGNFAVPLLYAVLAVCSVVLVVLSFICKGVPSPKFPVGKNPVLGLSSLVAAGGFVWDVIVIYRDVFPEIRANVSFDYLKNQFLLSLQENGGFFLVLEFVFAILSVLYFLIFAASHFEGKPTYKKCSILALSPLCWAMSVLIMKLMKAVSYVTVSELLFEIIAFVFLMLFFLTFARIVSDVFTENSMWNIYGSGFVAAIFLALISVPRLVAASVGLEPVKESEFSLTHLTLFIFVTVFILSSLGIMFKRGKNVKVISDVELPDDSEVVVKGSDVAEIPAEVDTVSENVEKNNSKKQIVLENVEDLEIDSDVENLFEDDQTTDEEVVESAGETADEAVVTEQEEAVSDETAEETEEEIVEEATEAYDEDIEEVSVEILAEDNPQDSDEGSVEEGPQGAVAETTEEVKENDSEDDGEVLVEEIAEESQEATVEEEAVHEEITEQAEDTAEAVVESEDESASQEESVITETVAEEIETVEEKNDVNTEASEEFVDFSEMLIEDTNDEQIEEKILKREKKYPVRYPVKSKKKKVSEEEPVKFVSLAELRKQKESE